MILVLKYDLDLRYLYQLVKNGIQRDGLHIMSNPSRSDMATLFKSWEEAPIRARIYCAYWKIDARTMTINNISSLTSPIINDILNQFLEQGWMEKKLFMGYLRYDLK